jgi:hypothetical protein
MKLRSEQLTGSERCAELKNSEPGSSTYLTLAALKSMAEPRRDHGFKGPTELCLLVLKEAEALAWDTGFPELFFPQLAHEKLAHLRQWRSRQQSIPRDLWDKAFAE